MKEQDKRAVEGRARCGISLEGLIDALPKFPVEEIKTIYNELHKDEHRIETTNISRNCS